MISVGVTVGHVEPANWSRCVVGVYTVGSAAHNDDVGQNYPGTAAQQSVVAGGQLDIPACAEKMSPGLRSKGWLTRCSYSTFK